MAVNIPQVVTEGKASGAFPIDGGCKFDGTKQQFLKKTFSGSGDRTKWTISCWMKYSMLSSELRALIADTEVSGSQYSMIGIEDTGVTFFYDRDASSNEAYEYSSARLRDPNSWYHLVYSVDIANDQLKLYINGAEVISTSSATFSGSFTATSWNEGGKQHNIGTYKHGSRYASYQLAQYYFVDGHSLGPGYFGYKDSLTNVWRPKKFRAEGTTVNDGTQWSAGAGSNFDSSNPATNGFDGDVTTIARTDNASVTATVTFSEPVHFTTLALYAARDSGNGFIKINGVDVSTQYTSGTGTLQKVDLTYVDGITSPLTSISLTGISGSAQPRFSAIEIDGVIMKDSTITNITYGTNGFYLPFDGSGCIGEDQSGQGNHWTPDNIVTSVSLEKSTGPKPILNTTPGGTKASSGVFGSKEGATYKVTASGGKFYLDGNVNPTLSGFVKGATYVFDTSDSTNDTHPFIFGTDTESANYNDGVARSHNNGTTWSSSFASSSGSFGVGDATTCFNGDLSSRSGIDNTTGNGNLTLTVDFKDVHVVEILTGSQNTLAVNGGSVVATAAADPQWIKYDPGTAFDLTTITVASQSGTGGLRVDCYGIKVDGILLEDGLNNRFTSITVPHNVPSTIYYHCGVHAGMGNSISGFILDESKADPYAWKCVAAVPLFHNKDYSNEINPIITPKTVASQEGSQSYSPISNFYGTCLDTGAASARNTTSLSRSIDFALSEGGTSNPWTVEIWGYRTTNTPNSDYMPLWEINGDSGLGVGWLAFLGSHNSLNYFYYGSGGSHDSVTWPLSPVNQWVHNAFVSDGTNLMVFEDGICVVRTAISALNGPPAYFGRDAEIVFGAQNFAGDPGTRNYAGQLQDFRVYKGVAKYTASAVGEHVYVPGSADPNILPDSPSGVSNRTKLDKITEGAVAFDGTGDFLRAESGDFAMGTGDFTVEAYIYNNTHVDYRNYIGIRESGQAAATGWCIASNASGDLYVYSNGLNTNLTTKMATKKWYHVAYTRASGTHYWWVDGVLCGTDSSSRTYSDDKLTIGANSYNDGELCDGLISNVRIIKGTALYNSNFVPPSKPLTNVTNTKLLCCQSSTSAGVAAVSPNLGGINDGRVWSDFSSLSNPGLIFDGNDDTYADSSATSGGSLITVDTQFTVPEGQLLTIRTQSGGTSHITVNGVNISTASGNNVTTLVTGGVGGTLVTSITAPTGFNLYYLKLNGVSLMDPIAPSGDTSGSTFNPFSTDINSVRGQEGNYATFNPLVLVNGGSSVFSDSNLSIRGASTNGASGATINPTSGKYYFELDIRYVAGQSQGNMGVGVINEQVDYAAGNPSAASYPTTFCGFFTRTEINSVVNGSETGAQITEPTVSYTWGLTVDYDIKEMTLYLNGVKGNTVSFSALTEPILYFTWGNTDNTMVVNFGQKPFSFPPPDGYGPVTSSTLRPETIIPRPGNQYVGATLYSGDAGPTSTPGTQDIKTGFKPDLVWIKGTSESIQHRFWDSVRGDAQFNTNSNGASSAWAMVDLLSDGFRIGNDASEQNKTGTDYVAWTWKAGGDAGTWNKDGVAYASAAEAGLTGITSPATLVGASIGTKQGFSIIRWNRGANHPTWTTGVIPHGLTQTPGMIITKNMGSGHGWMVFHTSNGIGRLYLDDTGVAQSGGYTTLPTATHFTMDNTSDADSTDDCMSYCWHDVPGLQKFGRYIGNASTSGAYVELGFKPAIVMVKRISGASANWYIMDYKNQTVNPVTHAIEPNTSDQMNTATVVNYDFLSNGFKIRGTDGDINASGHPYLYAAWAEQPSYNLYGAVATSR